MKYWITLASLAVFGSTAALAESASVSVSLFVPAKCSVSYASNAISVSPGETAPVGQISGSCNLPHRVSAVHPGVGANQATVSYGRSFRATGRDTTTFAELEGARRYSEAVLFSNVTDDQTFENPISTIIVQPAL